MGKTDVVLNHLQFELAALVGWLIGLAVKQIYIASFYSIRSNI